MSRGDYHLQHSVPLHAETSGLTQHLWAGCGTALTTYTPLTNSHPRPQQVREAKGTSLGGDFTIAHARQGCTVWGFF